MLFPSWRRQRRRLLILDIGAHLTLLSSLDNVTRINNQTNHDSQQDDEHATYQKQPLSLPFADLLPRLSCRSASMSDPPVCELGCPVVVRVQARYGPQG